MDVGELMRRGTDGDPRVGRHAGVDRRLTRPLLEIPHDLGHRDGAKGAGERYRKNGGLEERRVGFQVGTAGS